MKILEIGAYYMDGSDLIIPVGSSFGFEDCSLAVGALMRNGTAGFLNWVVEFDSFSPQTIVAESVLNVKGRNMLKMKHTLGNEFVFEGCAFRSIGESSGYLLLDRHVPGLKTGSVVEVFTAAYKYKIRVLGTSNDDLNTLKLTVSKGKNDEHRQIKF